MFRDRFRARLHLNDPPRTIALAAALGAFTPLRELHTVLCLLLARLFRVSPALSLSTSLIVIYTVTYLAVLRHRSLS